MTELLDTLIVVTFTIVIAGVTSLLLTGLVRRYALERSVIDVPNARSSHALPTPRGGGLAIAMCYIVSIELSVAFQLIDMSTAIGLFGVVAITLVGWWDDHADLPAFARLLVQTGASWWTVRWLGGLSELSLGSTVFHMGLWGEVIAVMALVWMTNLYNFMDGIDGLAGVEALIAGTTISVMLWILGSSGLAAISCVLAAAALGFLLWNWPPAKIFMGDVGSGTVGFAFGSISLAAWHTSRLPVVIALLPLGVFIADATFTLVRRLLKGERVLAAHRSHIYQQLVQRGWSHRRVTTASAVLTGLLALLAFVAFIYPQLLPLILAFATMLIFLSGWFVLRLSPQIDL